MMDSRQPRTPFDEIRLALQQGQTVGLDTLSALIVEDAAAFDTAYPEQAQILRMIEPSLVPRRKKQITL